MEQNHNYHLHVSLCVRAEVGVVSVVTLTRPTVGRIKVVIAVTNPVHATPRAVSVVVVVRYFTVPVHCKHKVGGWQ